MRSVVLHAEEELRRSEKLTFWKQALDDPTHHSLVVTFVDPKTFKEMQEALPPQIQFMHVDLKNHGFDNLIYGDWAIVPDPRREEK